MGHCTKALCRYQFAGFAANAICFVLNAHQSSLTGADGNDTDDTSPTYKVLEEGANTLSKEETTRLAQRQLKFIQFSI